MNSTKRIRRFLLGGLLLLIAWTGQPCMALKPAETVKQIVDYEGREFSKEDLSSYRNNPDYQYSRENPKPLERKHKERKRQVRERNVVSPPSGPRGDFGGLAKAFLWVMIGALVLVLLYQLFKIKFKGLLKKKSDEAIVETAKAEDVEDIRTMEFDNLLNEAINQKRYRHAVRLLYLQSLRQLQDRSLIQWRREKTNRDYIRELQGQPLHPLFDNLTFMFDYIWYGEFPVDQNHFNTARAGFMEFDQALRTRDAK